MAAATSYDIERGLRSAFAAVVLVVLWLAPVWVQATESCRPVQTRPRPTEPAEIEVPANLAVLCMSAPPVEVAKVLGVGAPVPFSCDARCSLDAPVDAEGVFEIRDAEGDVRRVVTGQSLAHALQPGDASVRQISKGPAVRLAPRTEGGDCAGLPAGVTFEVGHKYVASSSTSGALLDVVASDDEAPAPPKLQPADPQLLGIACRDHGAYRWVNRGTPHKLSWRVLDGDGSTQVVAPFISDEIVLAGFHDDDDASPGELRIGGHYVIEARAITRDGRTSPPIRIELDLQQTGQGDPAPGFGPFILWLLTMAGLLLAALVSVAAVAAIVVFIVIKVRGRG